ncbi:MAG TPA: DUF5671 domain-containing protein [Acidobacteriaceae bacterium]|nr:DUF5671 domain-containing protein [Acidobacteriaceae bacterium]
METGIAEFIEKTLAAGIPAETAAKILTAQGWPEKVVYAALGEHYQKVTGVEIPRRAAAGTSAKDAFFYLLLFATLATWMLSLGSLAFSLIDHWFADPLVPAYQGAMDTYSITTSLAAILVAYPLFLLISRTVARETAAHPEKLDSGIRKWLTYMALVVAAGIFMGDLITVLGYLLRGALTSQFVAKSFVVLALSGSVFFYYFGGVRRTDTAAGGSHRLMAGISAAVVAVMLVLGFLQLGPPREQRELRADNLRVRQIYGLSMQISNYWKSNNSQLPADLSQLPGAALGSGFDDPITHARYEYRPGQNGHYALCANFAQRSRSVQNSYAVDVWLHPSGHYCFQLNAAVMPQYPVLALGD